MQKTALTLMIAASLLFTMSACQPQSDRLEAATGSDKSPPSTQTVKKSDTSAISEAATPKALTKALVTMSRKRLTDELICTKLSSAMSDIDDKSKFEDIYAIQRQLEACLPITDNDQILQWLVDYQALYGRFLEINNNTNEQSFYTLMSMLEQGEKPSLELLKAINPRLLYLVGLVESKADVSVLYLGEGDYIFHHDLKAMADLFTPYLPQDQSSFIQRLAKDNQGIFWNDAGVAISFDEVIERAIFWEDYIQRYPTGYAIDDAKSLLAIYRYVLFFGSENTQWTDDKLREFYNSADEQAMQKLAKRPSSNLAQDAQNLLDFMALSNSKRHKKYPTPSKNNSGYKMGKRAMTYSQLTAALQIPSPWQADHKNCFNGVICVDNAIK